jgi:hypothetical protein
LKNLCATPHGKRRCAANSPFKHALAFTYLSIFL